jgi:3',5'-cyclic AMP phosphodiesterase CpdA
MTISYIHWLHISDLHCGQRGHASRWPSFREKALASMKEMTAEHGSPDLILFTGDLTFSGRAEEFEQVDRTRCTSPVFRVAGADGRMSI